MKLPPSTLCTTAPLSVCTTFRYLSLSLPPCLPLSLCMSVCMYVFFLGFHLFHKTFRYSSPSFSRSLYLCVCVCVFVCTYILHLFHLLAPCFRSHPHCHTAAGCNPCVYRGKCNRGMRRGDGRGRCARRRPTLSRLYSGVFRLYLYFLKVLTRTADIRLGVHDVTLHGMRRL